MIISSGEAQRADHRVGDDERERHDERCRNGTISSMAPSSSVQLERVERARTSECVSDVVERRTALLRFPELLGEGVMAGWLEGAASAQRAVGVNVCVRREG